AFRRADHLAPEKADAARGMARHRIGQELQDRQGGHRLAGAALADQRQSLAAIDREGNAAHRIDDDAVLHGEAHAQVAHDQHRLRGRRARPAALREDGVAHPSLRGSKASRAASPTKTRRLSMKARVKKAVRPSQGACRLFLPCASSSPSDGEPGGRPKPRKSSEVRVVIEPVRMKGMKVMVATMALGSTWRQMILKLGTPSARAART